MTRTIGEGHLVKVKGLGKGGKIGDGWYVVRLTQRQDNVNVLV